MTQDEIIGMARQAQFHEELYGEHFIYEFAKLVADKEREACAKVCDAEADFAGSNGRMDASAANCAAAIRARSTE
jgi:hypothetical protein